MKYALLVAWREYAENAKTKGFWIGMLLFPVILILSIQVPILLEQKATPVRYFVLVDQSGNLAPAIRTALEQSYERQVLAALKDYARQYAAPPAQSAKSPAGPPMGGLENGNAESLDSFLARGGKKAWLERLQPWLRPDAPPFQEPRRLFQEVSIPKALDTRADLANLAENLKPYLRHERRFDADGAEVELAAAILIPHDVESLVVRPTTQPTAGGKPASHPPATGAAATAADQRIQFWSANASDPALRNEIERAVNAEVHRREYLARGLDASLIRQVEQTYAPMVNLDPRKEKGRETMGTADVVRQWAPSAFVYLLWVAIFSVMQMLLSNTVEEKSNRIIEVLLSSITPGELMMGKLFGIAAIGLTMIGAWMVAFVGILSWKSGGASEMAGQVFTVLRTSNLVPVFAIYFLLGYLMYGAFILSIGSVCNTLKEAQSYMGVMTMVMMVPLLTLAFIPKDPNGTVARVLSWIPLYTPFVMMNRATANPPLVDLLGTLLLLLACSAGALFMAGKIFRIGVLRTGQPPRLVEMLRWALRR